MKKVCLLMGEGFEATWNFIVTPELLIEDMDINDFDALAIPGGFEQGGFYEEAFSQPFQDVIREFDRQGKIIASICVGGIPVGKSGVLKGRNGTTYNLSEGRRQDQLASYGINVLRNQPIVEDNNIITSYNPSTALDVAFLLLERLTTTENTNNIKRLMGIIK